MFPTAKRKRGPGKSSMPFKKRKLSMSKASGAEKSRSKPAASASFGARKFGGKSMGKMAAGNKGFRAGKMEGVSSRFGKSKEGKRFGKNKGERFGGKKSGAQSSKGKGQRPFKAGSRGGQAKKDFKKKKEKR